MEENDIGRLPVGRGRTLAAYMEDLELIPEGGDNEHELLIERLCAGDSDAIGRMMELYLAVVLEMAQDMGTGSIPVSDLAQEGNVAAMEAMLDFAGSGIQAGREEFSRFVMRRVKKAMEEFADIQEAHARDAAAMAEDANRLLKVTMEFEEEYDRAATLSELSQMLNRPPEYVELLVRITKRAMDREV